MTILDEFTVRRDVSRQRRWQLRKIANGLCPVCGAKAVGQCCAKHTQLKRVAMRKKLGSKPQWRYRNDPK